MFGSILYLKNSIFKQTKGGMKNIEYYDNGELDKFLIKDCEVCSLLPLNKKIVYGYGNKKPEIFMIIESPSKIDIFNNKLLSGPPGKLMDKILLAIKRTRNKSVYITSLIKYKHENNRNPLSSEISCNIEHLNKQIKSFFWVYIVLFVTFISIYLIQELLTFRYLGLDYIYGEYVLPNLIGFGYFNFKEILFGISIERELELFGV